MAIENSLVIDDRSLGGYAATSGGEWRLVTDGVMGGISSGQLTAELSDNQRCLRMRGDVRLDNNGGFIQAALDLPEDVLLNIRTYSGLTIAVYGNNEDYNIHLRTLDNSRPWQSYRATFTAASEWKELHLPFADFKPYRTSEPLDTSRLTRIGIVAIGREFKADICIGKLGLYRS